MASTIIINPTTGKKVAEYQRITVSEAKEKVAKANKTYKSWKKLSYDERAVYMRKLATMGAGLPSAMMAKELYPDRKVISVNGDGGFMMNSQELETAVRLGLDLVVIILNDNAYGMIQWKQEGEGFPKYGLDCGNPDFVKYAESFGATGHRPSSVDNFKEILKKALDSKGVQVIDLSVDYSLNHEILNVLIKEYSNNIKK